jgi:hypothetical protein
LVEKASEAAAVRRLRTDAAALWSATANPDGPGLLLPGHEFAPVRRQAFDARAVAGVLRLARLSAEAADAWGQCPDARVRRAAAVLAARAYPVRAGLDD